MDPKYEKSESEDFNRYEESDTESSEISDKTESGSIKCVGICKRHVCDDCENVYSSDDGSLSSENVFKKHEDTFIRNEVYKSYSVLKNQINVKSGKTKDPDNVDEIVEIEELFESWCEDKENKTEECRLYTTKKIDVENKNDREISIDFVKVEKSKQNKNTPEDFSEVNFEENAKCNNDEKILMLDDTNEKFDTETRIEEKPNVINLNKDNHSVLHSKDLSTLIPAPNSSKDSIVTCEETSSDSQLQNLFLDLINFRKALVENENYDNDILKMDFYAKQINRAVNKYSKLIISTKIRLLQCKSDVQLFMNILDLLIRIIASCGRISLYDGFMYFHMEKGLYFTAIEIRSDLVSLNNKLNAIERNMLKTCCLSVSDCFVALPKLKKSTSDSTVNFISCLENLENDVFTVFKCIRKFLRRCKSKKRYKVEFNALQDKLNNSIVSKVNIEHELQSKLHTSSEVQQQELQADEEPNYSEHQGTSMIANDSDPRQVLHNNIDLSPAATGMRYRYMHIPLSTTTYEYNHFQMPTTIYVPNLVPSTTMSEYYGRYAFPHVFPTMMCTIRTSNQQIICPIPNQISQYFDVRGMNVSCRNGLQNCTCNVPFFGLQNSANAFKHGQQSENLSEVELNTADNRQDKPMNSNENNSLNNNEFLATNDNPNNAMDNIFEFLEQWPRTYPQTILKEDPKKCFECLMNITNSILAKSDRSCKLLKTTKKEISESSKSRKFRWLRCQLQSEKKAGAQNPVLFSENKIRTSLAEVSKLAFEVGTIFTTHLEDLAWMWEILEQCIIMICNTGNFAVQEGTIVLQPHDHKKLHKIAVTFRNYILSKKNDIIDLKKRYCTFLHTTYEKDTVYLDINELNDLEKKKDSLKEAEIVLEKIKSEINEIAQFLHRFLQVFVSTFPDEKMGLDFHNMRSRLSFELGL